MRTMFQNFAALCKKQLTARTFKQGMFSLALIALVLAIVIAVNILFSTLPTIYTSFDLTDRKQNENLSTTTKNYVSALEREIVVYLLVVPGTEDARVMRILERYESLSANLRVETVNPELHPNFAAAHDVTRELSEGSLIVESNLRTKSIAFSEYYIDASTISFAEGMYTFEGVDAFAEAYTNLYEAMSNQGMKHEEIIQTMAGLTYSQYKEVMDHTLPESILNLEAELTTAIDYVNRKTLSTVYALTGHGEASVDTSLAATITGENIELKSLNLLESNAIPADCHALFLCAPTKDYTEAELATLKTYLAQGGHLLLLAGNPTLAPSLYALIESEYGVAVKNGTVFDGERYSGNPAYVLPTLGTHAGVDANVTAATNVLLFRARALDITTRTGVTTTPLLSSSAAAWFRSADSTVTDLSAQPSKGDVTGTYHYGVAIEQARENGATTQIVYLGSSSIMNVFQTNVDTNLNALTSGGNFSYLLATLLWNVDAAESLTMESAAMTYEPRLLLPETTATVWLVALAIVLPLGVAALGVVRTARRRVR